MPILTEPVDVNFGKQEDLDLKKFVKDNLLSLENSFDKFHTTLVPKWDRLYKGTPKETTRSFPWPGASNLVVQLIGENCDTLKAIMLASTWELLPVWPVGLVGDFQPEEMGEEQRSAYERFLDLMALSKEELDLQRVEALAATDITKYGTVALKIPYTTCTEELVTGVDNEGKLQSEEITKYEGPKVEKLDIRDWAASPKANTLESAHFKYHRIPLVKQQIQEKVFRGHFDKKETEEILKSPDREGFRSEDQLKLQAQGLDSELPNQSTAEWDFYECWFWYWHNDKKYRIIYTYHKKTDRCVKAVFNFFLNNEEPWELGRLGYTDDGLMGYGFCEMGEYYQDAECTLQNQRIDNRTLLNTSVILTGRHSKLDAGFSIFPNCTLPIDPTEFSIETLGAKADSSVAEEEMIIALAKARFGTNIPDTGGSGSGTTNPKKGTYSAQGTFAIMQQGTRRVNINISDFRYMHLNIGQKVGRQYAQFGAGEKRLKALGELAKILQKALNNVKNGRIELPVRAATASINREVEKQTGMLFVQVMERHYQAIGQILQGISNPMMPSDLKEFYIGSIRGQAYLMAKLVRAFGYDDVYRMLPELKLLEKLNQTQGAGNNGQQPVSKATTNGAGIGEDQSISGGNGAQGAIPPTLPNTTGGNANRPM